jgi:type II secretory ATPase GspE/PulE/Tfp pilus assembly ATPase PilB-like protein
MGQVGALVAVDVGPYINGLKVLPVLVILWAWALSLTWVDKDAEAAHLPRETLNCVWLGGLVLAIFLFLLIPDFWGALAVFLVLYLAEAGTYLGLRHAKVGLADLKKDFKTWRQGIIKDKEVAAEAGQVSFVTAKGSLLPPPGGNDPDRAAYEAVQKTLTDPLRRHADQIDLAPEGDGFAVKYVVDGVAYRGSVFDRFLGTGAIEYLKSLAGLELEDRRKPQTGSIKVMVEGKRRILQVQTAGTRAGEYLRAIVDLKQRHDFTLQTLGLDEKQLTQMRESIKENKGIVLVAAPKGQGLTSMLYALLRGHDAFIQHIQTIEREPDQDLDGITQNKLAAGATAAEEEKAVSWAISQEPNVLMVSSVESPQSARLLIKGAQGVDRRIYVGIRAANTSEAIEKWVKLVGNPQLAGEALQLVISGRVLRKLCSACKIAYTPDPATLRKLNMRPEMVTTLYQARTYPMKDEKGNIVPCIYCHDLYFKGRTGFFELMAIDEEARNLIAAGKPVAPAFRAQRGRDLQQQALALVESGDTSVQEMLRVLRGPDLGKTAAQPASAPTPAAASAPHAPSGVPATPARKPTQKT